MKKIVLAMLSAIPLFSHNQVKPMTTHTVTHQPLNKPLVSLSTGLGDTVLAQIADGGGWQTTITVLNLRSTPTTFSIICYGDDGNPQSFSWAGVGAHASLSGSLAGFGSSEVQTTGTAAATSDG